MIVNGKNFPYEKELNILELLKQLDYSHPNIMITVNGEIISKENYGEIRLKEIDVVKIIHPIVGG